MKLTKMTIIGSVLSFLIGTIFGAGGYWKFQEIEISRSKTTTDLRSELSKLMDNVITITAAFKPLKLCEGKTPETNNKAIELHAKLELYQDNFEVLERKLANLEGREPREINLQFSPPCPPKIMSITVN